jgi:acyl-ACP thioesterase
MEKTGIYDYKTELYSLDFRGQLTIPALGTYLLHAATRHAAARGFSYNEIAERDMLWVLSRLIIDIKDNKKLSEPIRIYTWIQGVDRIVTYRCFEITTQQGETLGFARSVWAAINHETRRPMPLEILRLQDHIVERPCPIALDKFDVPENMSDYPVPYKVKYSDLDINGHFNSIKYMESILDLFEIDIYRTRSIARFDIMYHSEGFYGMELALNKAQINENEYVATISRDGKLICKAKTLFKKTT